MKLDRLLKRERYVSYSLSSIIPESFRTCSCQADDDTVNTKDSTINQQIYSHLCKHRIFVNRPVLHSTTTLPDDLLVLLEPPVEQVNLGQLTNFKTVSFPD